MSTIEHVTQDFLDRLVLPAEKPSKPFVLGIVGQIGSGKTTIARLIAPELSGTVIVQANSARFLLKEADMPWGDNVRDIVRLATQRLLAQGYAVIFDGSSAEEKDRQNAEQAVAESGAPVFYVRIAISTENAKAREKTKYDDPAWVSSFEDFRVNTTDKMLANIDERAEVHTKLSDSQIPNLLGVLDNNGPKKGLASQLSTILAALQQRLT